MWIPSDFFVQLFLLARFPENFIVTHARLLFALANTIPESAELCAFFPTLLEGLLDYSPMRRLYFIDDSLRDCATFSFFILIVWFHILCELLSKTAPSDCTHRRASDVWASVPVGLTSLDAFKPLLAVPVGVWLTVGLGVREGD
jgi:hypothetical protein